MVAESRPRAEPFLAVIGLAGIAAQTALVRELMSALAGDELAAALVLGVWLCGGALGALLAPRAGPNRSGLAVSLLGAAAIASGLLALPATALLRPLFGLLAGETVPLYLLLPGITAIALVPGAAHSALFVTACDLFSGRDAPGYAYLWRGLGTGVGGLLVYLVLVGRVPGPAIVAACGLPLTALLAFAGNRPGRIMAAALGLGLSAVVALGPRIERLIQSAHWPGQAVIAVRDSPYGRAVVLERAGTRAVLVDGATAAVFPSITVERDELLAHIGLLAHPAPERVFIAGALPDGLAVEALRHPVAAVTCVTLDPVPVTLAGGPGTDDPRLHLAIADPVAFLCRDTTLYDCIILPAGSPNSLGANRLATVEFYQLCRTRLSSQGVFVARGPGQTAAGRFARLELAVRLASLEKVFGPVQVVGTDPAVLVASRGSVTPALSADTARKRLAERGIETFTVAAQLGRLDESPPEPGSPGLPVNSIARPTERFLAMLDGLDRSLPALARAWLGLGRRGPAAALAGIAALFLLALLVVRQGRRASRYAALLTSGLAGSGVSLLNLFALQVVTGAAYSGVVMLFASFTFGNAAGAWWAGRAAGRQRQALFVAADVILALAALAAGAAAFGAPPAVFPTIAVVTGVCLGLQFALAGQDRSDFAASRRAGPLAALDLAGGVAGALVIPVVVIPTFGLVSAALALAGAKFATTAALVLARD